QIFPGYQFVGRRRRVDAGIHANVLGIESHPGQRLRQDVERLQARVDGAEQGRLDELQVPMITGGQLLRDVQYLVERGLRDGAAASNQLEDVRVALLGHDRRARRESFRQADE